MKDLKVWYGDHYDWMYPVSGDRHLMKTAATVINIILYSEMVGSCNLTGRSMYFKDLWVWVDNFIKKENNEVTQFWIQMLIYLHRILLHHKIR